MAQLHALVETAQPVRAPFGLLSPAADVVTDKKPHWVNGFSYEVQDCLTEVNVRNICTTSVVVTAVAPVAGSHWLNYVPFSVEAAYNCSTIGMLGQEAYAKKAQDRLDLCFQKAVEFELWTGALATASAASSAAWNSGVDGAFPNRFLASSGSVDVTPTPGTALKPVEGLSALEGALGNCGCGSQGTIHATRSAASVLAPYLTRSTNDTLYTALENYVIAGVGYPGTGPTGIAPGGTKTWMYATGGQITVRRGDIFITPEELAQSVKTDTNDVAVKAEQPASVTWPGCCSFAVLIDLASSYN